MIKQKRISRDVYFQEAKEDIARTNLRLLRISSVLMIVFLAVFISVTPLFFPTWRPTYPYRVFACAAVMVTAVIFIYSRSGKAVYESVRALCIFFYIAVLLGCICVDVLPDSSGSSTFFPLIIIVLPAVFIMPYSLIFSITGALEAFYLFMVFTDKVYIIALMDAYTSIVACCCTVAVALIVMDLRVEDGLDRYRYKRQGTVDQLTKLLNRAECETQIREYFRIRKAEDPICALIMFDIDNFKQINDTFGHQEGDQILEEVGSILREGFRAGDIVGRVGGDEFLVMIKNIHEESNLSDVACRIGDSIRNLSEPTCDIEVSCSLGIARIHGIIPYEDAYRDADQAMYEAKRLGRSRYVIHDIYAEEG